MEFKDMKVFICILLTTVSASANRTNSLVSAFDILLLPSAINHNESSISRNSFTQDQLWNSSTPPSRAGDFNGSSDNVLQTESIVNSTNDFRSYDGDTLVVNFSRSAENGEGLSGIFLSTTSTSLASRSIKGQQSVSLSNSSSSVTSSITTASSSLPRQQMTSSSMTKRNLTNPSSISGSKVTSSTPSPSITGQSPGLTMTSGSLGLRSADATEVLWNSTATRDILSSIDESVKALTSVGAIGGIIIVILLLILVGLNIWKRNPPSGEPVIIQIVKYTEEAPPEVPVQPTYDIMNLDQRVNRKTLVAPGECYETMRMKQDDVCLVSNSRPTLYQGNQTYEVMDWGLRHPTATEDLADTGGAAPDQYLALDNNSTSSISNVGSVSQDLGVPRPSSLYDEPSFEAYSPNPPCYMSLGRPGKKNNPARRLDIQPGVHTNKIRSLDALDILSEKRRKNGSRGKTEVPGKTNKEENQSTVYEELSLPGCLSEAYCTESLERRGYGGSVKCEINLNLFIEANGDIYESIRRKKEYHHPSLVTTFHSETLYGQGEGNEENVKSSSECEIDQ